MWPFNKDDSGLAVKAGSTFTIKVDLTVRGCKKSPSYIVQQLVPILMKKHYGDIGSDKKIAKAIKKVLIKRTKDLVNELKDDIDNSYVFQDYGEGV